MKAAVVESYESAPRYRDFDEPSARDDEFIVAVKAAGCEMASGKFCEQLFTSVMVTV